MFYDEKSSTKLQLRFLPKDEEEFPTSKHSSTICYCSALYSLLRYQPSLFQLFV